MELSPAGGAAQIATVSKAIFDDRSRTPYILPNSVRRCAMATHIATLTSKGQITLPSRMRKELGLKAGDKIAFVEDGSGGYRVGADRPSIADLRGIAKLNRRVTGEEIDQWIREARAARARLPNDRG
jgi:AbrB family looped-hinge helix DNA binding protein